MMRVFSNSKCLCCLTLFSDTSRIRRVLSAYVQQGSGREDRGGETERRGRQAGTGGGGGGGEDGDCENKGYETKIQEICEKVLDTECSNVTVTKTRKDIKKTCRTRVGLALML